MRRAKVIIHSRSEVEGIRRAAQTTAWVRDELCRRVRPGMSTGELDRIARTLIAETGGTSAFNGYHGFPGQICISINEEVVHGIGNADRLIAAGDLVSLDVGVRLEGFIGDTATTVPAGGGTSAEARRLVGVAKQALQAGIARARCGNTVNDISKAVQETVESSGFSVVRDFVGHGCGCELHEPPEVPNFAQSHPGARLRAGMVLAIEPMVNSGSYHVTVDEKDGWTVRTRDGGLSAHVEHMVLITKDEPEILTWPKTASE